MESPVSANPDHCHPVVGWVYTGVESGADSLPWYSWIARSGPAINRCFTHASGHVVTVLAQSNILVIAPDVAVTAHL